MQEAQDLINKCFEELEKNSYQDKDTEFNYGLISLALAKKIAEKYIRLGLTDHLNK
jgi:hypothetical protein